MRPEILFKLFSPQTILSGIGPRTRLLTEKITGPHVVNLLWLLPINIVSRTLFEKLVLVPKGEVATLKVKVLAHKAAYNRRQPYTVDCMGYDEPLRLIFFNGKKLLIDPFITGNKRAKNLDITGIKPEYILITHGHQDHLLDAELIANNNNATIISNHEIV